MNIYLIYKYMHNIHTINLYKNKNNSNNEKHYYYILNNLFLHNDLINQDINLARILKDNKIYIPNIKTFCYIVN